MGRKHLIKDGLQPVSALRDHYRARSLALKFTLGLYVMYADSSSRTCKTSFYMGWLQYLQPIEAATRDACESGIHASTSYLEGYELQNKTRGPLVLYRSPEILFDYE